MASLDIFNGDAFSLTELTGIITDIPRVPTLLGDDGLFTESGINKTSMFLERQGDSIHLVPTAPRGGVREPGTRGKRKLIPIAATHLPQSDSVLADEVQGIRAFGSETEVETVQGLVRERLTNLKRNLDLTLEHMRVGAIKGKVVDADGVSEIWDLYDLFDMTQTVKYFDFSNANSDLKAKTIDLKRSMQTALGGRPLSGVRVYASLGWFDTYVNHAKMLAAWDKWQEGAYLRQDQSERDFEFMGVTFRIYPGGTSAGDFIPDGEAYAVPLGVPGMFQTKFAPGDYMETVNTTGLPYYARQQPMDFNKGVELESQSNPIMVNTLPEAVFKLVETSGP